MLTQSLSPPIYLRREPFSHSHMTSFIISWNKHSKSACFKNHGKTYITSNLSFYHFKVQSSAVLSAFTVMNLPPPSVSGIFSIFPNFPLNSNFLLPPPPASGGHHSTSTEYTSGTHTSDQWLYSRWPLLTWFWLKICTLSFYCFASYLKLSNSS